MYCLCEKINITYQPNKIFQSRWVTLFNNGPSKNRVFRNFTKFTGKHLYKGLFFNKVAGLRPVFL